MTIEKTSGIEMKSEVTDGDAVMKIADSETEKNAEHIQDQIIWGPWTSCSVTCGLGVQKQSAICQQGHSSECDPRILKTRSCIQITCNNQGR